MFLSFGLLIKAVLLVAGIIWCKEILGRFRSDLEKVKSPESNMERGIIILFWVITVVIIYWIAKFAWWFVNSILGTFM